MASYLDGAIIEQSLAVQHADNSTNDTHSEGEVGIEKTPTLASISLTGPSTSDLDAYLDSLNLDKPKFDLPDTKEYIIIDTNSSRIKAATLSKLIEKLTAESATVKMCTDFLFTYRSFSIPLEVLNYLKCRFDSSTESLDETMTQSSGGKITKMRVLNILKLWIEKVSYDFKHDQETLQLIQKFVSYFYLREPRLTKPVKYALDHLPSNSQSIALRSGRIFANVKPTSLVSSTLDPAKFKLNPTTVVELARQLTLAEWKLWEAICPHEFLDQNWMGKDKRKDAPNIMALINHFNKIATWVSTAIVQVDNIDERAMVIEHFILLTKECLAINNFNAVMELLSGLGSASVFRLKKTWNLISISLLEEYKEIKKLMSSDGSFQLYRQELKKVNPPTIPYVAVYLTDLIYIQDGSLNYLTSKNKLINFGKFQTISTVIENILQYQQCCYNFHFSNPLQKYLDYLELWEETTIYNYSLYQEPRNGASQPVRPIVIKISSPTPWEKVHEKITLQGNDYYIQQDLLIYATLQQAIKYLLFYQKKHFIELFYYTHKCFTTMQEILDCLIKELNYLKEYQESLQVDFDQNEFFSTRKTSAIQGTIKNYNQALSDTQSGHQRVSLNQTNYAADEKGHRIGVVFSSNPKMIPDKPVSYSQIYACPLSNHIFPFNLLSYKDYANHIIEFFLIWRTKFNADMQKDGHIELIEDFLDNTLSKFDGIKEVIDLGLAAWQQVPSMITSLEIERVRSINFRPRSNRGLVLKSSFNLLLVSPMDIAQQIALYNQSKVSSYSANPYDIFKMIFNPKCNKAPTFLVEMEDLYDNFQRWIRYEVIRTKYKRRINIIETFLEIAACSLEILDFSLCQNIYYAVVKDLQFARVLDNVSKRNKEVLNNLIKLFSNPYHLSRRIVNISADVPAIVPLGWIANELEQMRLHENFVNNKPGIIDFRQLRAIMMICQNVNRPQKQKYPFILSVEFINCLITSIEQANTTDHHTLDVTTQNVGN